MPTSPLEPDKGEIRGGNPPPWRNVKLEAMGVQSSGQPTEAALERLKERGRSRVTVVGQTSFVSHQQGPFAAVHAYDFQCSSDEQPYRRRFKISLDWQLLDLGWLKNAASMVVVENVEGSNPLAKEDEKVVSLRVVELSLAMGPMFCEITPGRDTRLFPTVPLFIRCRAVEGAFVQVTAFPR